MPFLFPSLLSRFIWIWTLCFVFWQIRFFHKLGSMPTPVTDTEKLIWAVLEAERPTFRFSWILLLSWLDLIKIVMVAQCTYYKFFCSQLHGKSLIEANTLFLEKHKGHHLPYLMCTQNWRPLILQYFMSYNIFQIPWCIEQQLQKCYMYWILATRLRLSNY